MDFKKSIIVYYAIGLVSLIVAYVSLTLSGLVEWGYTYVRESPLAILFILASLVAYAMFFTAGVATLLMLYKKK